MVIVECLLKHGVDINTYDWVQESKSVIVYGKIMQDSAITSLVILSSDILFHSYFYLKHK